MKLIIREYEQGEEIGYDEYEYGELVNEYNIDELPSIWENTCPLRFISNWKLDRQDYVRQFHLAEFEFID